MKDGRKFRHLTPDEQARHMTPNEDAQSTDWSALPLPSLAAKLGRALVQFVILLAALALFVLACVLFVLVVVACVGAMAEAL